MAVGAHLETHVQGRWERFGEGSCVAVGNVRRIGGVYKLGKGVGKRGDGRGRGRAREREGGNGVEGGSEDEEARERAEMEVAILGLMALRGAS